MPTAAKELEHKGFIAFEIKDAEQGDVEACIATLGVVDNDGDYMRPGCIEDGSKVMMSDYGHSTVTSGARPVGKGVITVKGNKAMFKGRIFMDTQAGQETFKTLKAMGPDQEWSFGYRVVTASVPTDEEKGKGAYRSLDKLKSFEVSPVFMGAGLGTGTTAIKSQADGDSTDPEAKAAEKIIEKSVEQVPDVKQVTESAPATSEKSAEQIAIETKAEQARVEAEERTVREEMERFNRNMRRYA